MKGNFHVRFLEEGEQVIAPSYSADGESHSFTLLKAMETSRSRQAIESRTTLKKPKIRRKWHSQAKDLYVQYLLYLSLRNYIKLIGVHKI